MIPEGTFKARGIEGALGYTSAGNDQVAVSFVLLESESAGSQITWYGQFTDKTTERTIESLRTCGWQGDDLSDLTGIDANEVWLVIAHEEDLQGVPRARVRWVNGGGGVQMKDRMGPGEAKAFAAKMKGAVLAQRTKSGAAPAAATTPSRTPPSGRQPAPAANRSNAGRRPPPRDEAPPPDDSDIPY